jgi:hypothetical protein
VSLLAPGETVPSFDTARYAIALLLAPATGFTVGDRLPRLAVTVAHDTPVWGVSAHLTATLTNSAGKPLAGAHVTLQRRAGGSWIRASLGFTGTDGVAQLAFVPTQRTKVRMTFAAPATQPAGAEYEGAASASVMLTPHVRLSTPKTPATVISAGLLAIAGTVAPRQPAGKGRVRLVFQRFDGVAWHALRSVTATIGGGTTTSRYAAIVKLQTAGSWRVRAERPADAAFAAGASGWRAFAVK